MTPPTVGPRATVVRGEHVPAPHLHEGLRTLTGRRIDRGCRLARHWSRWKDDTRPEQPYRAAPGHAPSTNAPPDQSRPRPSELPCEDWLPARLCGCVRHEPPSSVDGTSDEARRHVGSHAVQLFDRCSAQSLHRSRAVSSAARMSPVWRLDFTASSINAARSRLRSSAFNASASPRSLALAPWITPMPG